MYPPRCDSATTDYIGSSTGNRAAGISDLSGGSRTAVTALVAERPDLVADGANSLRLPCPRKSSR